MELIDTIRKSWKWLDIDPKRIIDVNRFGNVIFVDSDEAYWRICPEELECKQIASSTKEFEVLKNDTEFTRDWLMDNLVEAARSEFGDPGFGRCYCLKMPGVLGGKYEVANMGTISIPEVLAFAGEVAEQIKDLPDGSQIKFRFIE